MDQDGLYQNLSDKYLLTCKEKKNKKHKRKKHLHVHIQLDGFQMAWTGCPNTLKNKTKENKKGLWLFSLYPIQFLTQELLHAVCVPLEDAEFFSNVPAVVQKL